MMLSVEIKPRGPETTEKLLSEIQGFLELEELDTECVKISTHFINHDQMTELVQIDRIGEREMIVINEWSYLTFIPRDVGK